MAIILDPSDPSGIGQQRPSQSTNQLSNREPFSDIDVVYEQMEVWLRDREPHRVWAEQAVKSVEYIRGKQWPEDVLRKLAAEGRPGLTLNRIRPGLRLLIGYYLQNRTDVRFLPGNDAISTQDLAEALTKQMKQIDEETFYRWTEAAIWGDGLASGRGYLDMRLSFETNIHGSVVQHDFDPFSAYIDCDAGSYDIAQHNHVTVNRYMSYEDIAMMYGGQVAKKIQARFSNSIGIVPESETGEGDGDDIVPDRFFGLRDYLRNADGRFQRLNGVSTMVAEHVDRQRKVLRVLDRQHKKLKRVRFMVDWQTGDRIVIPDYWNRDRIVYVLQHLAAQGFQMSVQDGYDRRWRWTVTCLDTVLYDDWSPYQEPTIIGFFPYFERGITPSFATDLFDAQDEHNKRRSALTHAVMTASNSGWQFEEGTLTPEQITALERRGSAPGYIQEYRRPRPDSVPPRRIEPGMPPQGLRLLEREALEDIKEISGINDSAMGLVDKVQSGRAIEARQRQAIVTHEQAFDNMRHMRELRGRKGAQLIQGFYTQPRLVRTIADNGEDVQTWLNAMTTAGNLVNDVTQGRYRVSIDETPMSATFQAAQFDEMMAMVEKGLLPPEMADILIELSTVPRKEEIIQRLRQMQMVQQMQAGLMPPGAPGMPPGPGMPGDAAPMGPVGPGGGMPPGPGMVPGAMGPVGPMAPLPSSAMALPRMPGLPNGSPVMPGQGPSPVIIGPGGAPMRRAQQ